MKCKVEAISGQVSTDEVDNYETRCDGDKIYKYNMCGKKEWMPVQTCTAGQTCQQNAGKPLHKHTDAEGNTNIHPAHPDCEGDDCESPRNPAVRFVASGCGKGADVASSSAPQYDELCNAGYSPTRVALRHDAASIYGKDGGLLWQWGCSNDTTGGQEICEAPFYKWHWGWGECVGGQKILKFRCTRDNKTFISDFTCLNTIGAKPFIFEVSHNCSTPNTACGWKADKAWDSLGDTKVGLCGDGYRPVWGKDGWHEAPFSDKFEWKCQKISAENATGNTVSCINPYDNLGVGNCSVQQPAACKPVDCSATHADWMIGAWGQCESDPASPTGASRTRTVHCTTEGPHRTPRTALTASECLDAGAGDGFIDVWLGLASGGVDDTYQYSEPYIDMDGDYIPDYTTPCYHTKPNKFADKLCKSTDGAGHEVRGGDPVHDGWLDNQMGKQWYWG